MQYSMKMEGMLRNGLQFQFYGHERLFNLKQTCSEENKFYPS